MNPYTRLQKLSYLTTEFLQPLHCYMPFYSRGEFTTCRMAGGRLTQLPASAGLIHCLLFVHPIIQKQPAFDSFQSLLENLTRAGDSNDAIGTEV